MIYAQITGRLAVDAEVKEINGRNYIRALVPQQDRRDGPTTWVDVMCTTGDKPQGILSVLKKGAIVSAQGDLKVRAYSGKDGARADVTLWTGRINIEQFVRDETQQAPPQEKEEDDGPDLPF